ncbi:MAG: 3-hydroxyacyl-CoA dehydrogenase NAD-binding domain-containing protein [Thiohalomonadales bacterium]
MSKSNYNNWKLQTDDNNILWLHADMADASANTLSSAVLDELSDIIDGIDQQSCRGLIFLSDKPSGFFAGADINELQNVENILQASEFIRLGQKIFNRIEALRIPTVCIIHGFCMGGGLELALACKYRIADSDPKTKLGLPEVKLGIFPAFGGSARLPLLIGAPAAMDMMLSGRALGARAAQKMGVINYAVADRHLKKAAEELVLTAPKIKPLGGWKAFTNHGLVRPILAKVFRNQVAKKAMETHYPAPFTLIDLWAKHGNNKQEMMAGEDRLVSRMVLGKSAQNLMRVFFLQEKLKAEGDKSLYKPSRVHIIGAGVMGGDIAAWCALQGMMVTLQDRHEEIVAKALKRAHKLYKKKLKKPIPIQQAMDRLIPDIDGIGLAQADVVIEAIVENLEAKHSLFKDIEPRMKADAILATNTSSIPLDDLSTVLSDPKRLVGIHFFNPVAMMQLVEIVHDKGSDKATIDKACAFTRHINRLPLRVKSSPGFLVNRVLMPYLIEAVVLESEGVAAAVIDEAALDFGMPMGPIALADSVGLDICLSVVGILSESMSLEVPKRLKTLVDAGRLGRKTGHGFYVYKKGKALHDKPVKSDYRPVDIQDRLMLRMINEVTACLREGIVTSEDLVDAGIIFATGFAPFRGGPLHYVADQGETTIFDKLTKLEEIYGTRFTPDVGWEGHQEPKPSADAQNDAA